MGIGNYMFEGTNRLARAAELARLLDEIITAMSVDPRLGQYSQFTELKKISKRLTDYIEQTIRGERSSDWFNLEALAVRESLTRIANSQTFRNDKNQLNTAKLEVFSEGKISTKDEIANQLALIGIDDTEYSRYFLKIAHDILDQIDYVSNFSSNNPYRSKNSANYKAKN
jgi:hypothetical protein